MSEGGRVHGRLFRAEGVDEPTTLLFVPGWGCDDDLELGPLLSEEGINFCTFNPRGVQSSEGIHTHAGTLRDIGAALQWLGQVDVQKRLKVEASRLVLGGYSYGGGMAMAYAARDPSVRRVISVAGNDHGEFARELQHNAAFTFSICFIFCQIDNEPGQSPNETSLFRQVAVQSWGYSLEIDVFLSLE